MPKPIPSRRPGQPAGRPANIEHFRPGAFRPKTPGEALGKPRFGYKNNLAGFRSLRPGPSDTDRVTSQLGWVSVKEIRELADTGYRPGTPEATLANRARGFLLAADKWLRLPRERGNIGTLEACIRDMKSAAVTAKSMRPSPLPAPAAELARKLERLLPWLEAKLRFYHEVRLLRLPQTRQSIDRMLRQHAFTEGGRHFVNLYHHHGERLNPGHDDSTDLVERWLEFQASCNAANENAYDKLDEFMLQQCDGAVASSRRRYFNTAERELYKLRYGWEVERYGQRDRLHALYRVTYGDHRGHRYMHHLDGMPGTGILACRYMVHNSQHYDSNISKDIGDPVDGELYAMDGNYRLYTFPRSEVHSVLLGGEAVMCAGIVVIEEGKVVLIDNKSGHYQPKWRHLHQAVCELEFHNVLAPDATVMLVTASAHMLFDKDDFISLGNQQFPFARTRDTLAGYHSRYGEAFPAPPAVAERLRTSSITRAWQKGALQAYTTFLKQAFPRNMGRWDRTGRLLFENAAVPSLSAWKRQTDLGPLSRRDDPLLALDRSLDRAHRVLSAQPWPHAFVDLAAVERALKELLAVAQGWLRHKAEKTDSRRRPHVERLVAQVKEDMGFVHDLQRPRDELMVDKSWEGV